MKYSTDNLRPCAGSSKTKQATRYEFRNNDNQIQENRSRDPFQPDWGDKRNGNRPTISAPIQLEATKNTGRIPMPARPPQPNFRIDTQK